VGRAEWAEWKPFHENKSTQKETKNNQNHKTSVQFLRTDSLILDSTLCLELADNCPFEDV
jgi:hypothetical protein